jgi:hypothetical protein
MSDTGVGEELAFRVVSAAHRRRIRLVIVIGLIAVVLGGGVAVALTHRSGAGGRHPAAVKQSAAARAAVRRDIYAVAEAHYPRGSGSTTRVKFGPLLVHGAHARMSVEILCGPLCGRGEELTLARQDGRWHVTGVRHTWIS